MTKKKQTQTCEEVKEEEVLNSLKYSIMKDFQRETLQKTFVKKIGYLEVADPTSLINCNIPLLYEGKEIAKVQSIFVVGNEAHAVITYPMKIRITDGIWSIRISNYSTMDGKILSIYNMVLEKVEGFVQRPCDMNAAELRLYEE